VDEETIMYYIKSAMYALLTDQSAQIYFAYHRPS